MATIRKRGKTYQLDWYDAAGNRQRESLGKVDSATAKAALTKKKLELLGNPTGVVVVETVEEFSRTYLAWYKVQYPSSYDRVQRIFKNHIIPEFGSKPLNVVTPLDTTAWLIKRASIVRPESANKELKCLKAMFNRAVDWNTLPASPIKKVMALPERDDKPPEFYTPVQLKKLYKVCSLRNKYMWKFIANTGLRRQEALNLQHSHCAEKRILVLSTNDAPTKGQESRVIPLNDQARTALTALKELVQDANYVFPRMFPSSLSRLFAADAKRAKLQGSIHSLRHTFGANLVMAGVPIRSVQLLMGHASVETTEIYASVAPGYLKNMTAKIKL